MIGRVSRSSFLEKVFSEVLDAEGRVLDPLASGGIGLMEDRRL